MYRRHIFPNIPQKGELDAGGEEERATISVIMPRGARLRPRSFRDQQIRSHKAGTEPHSDAGEVHAHRRIGEAEHAVERLIDKARQVVFDTPALRAAPGIVTITRRKPTTR